MDIPVNAAKPGRRRYLTLVMIFITVVICYVDRANLAVASAHIQEEFGITKAQMGYVFSAFAWLYTLCQIPGGWFLDRVGSRVTYFIAIFGWSVATLFQGFATGLMSLIGLRAITGIFEAPAFPTNNRMVTSWFPEHERASAVGFYTSGQFVGLAFLTPLLIWIQEMLSWHWVFIVTGGIGIIWSLIWFKVYQPPRLTKGISKAELDYIRDGGGLVDGDAPVKKEARQPLTAKDWKLVFHRKLIGVYLGQFAVASTLWFFLTWFPTNNRMVTSWFPEHERASAVGFYTSGQFVGLAFLTPLLIWIQEMLSWHWVFIVTGGIGIIWSLIWFKVYQPPRLTKGISKAELDYIRDGGGLVDGDAPVKKEARQPLTAKDWKLVFHRKLIGVYLGQFAVASTLWFFLTWFPNYLTQEKGITALKAGFMTTVPFLAAFIGVLLSGWVADLLVRKGFSLGFARKTPIICGLLISTCIMGANYTNDPMMIMCLMALAFFGNGFASITWSLVSSLAPMRLIGLTGGVFNFAGGLGGITVPLVVGYLAQGYGFAPALVYISAVALIGALSYILLVGDVKRVG